ncbi:MAG: PilZ domain-containing protein [Acidobacteriota bacterium]
MTSPEHDASPQRSATRAPIDRPVRFQFDDSMEIADGHCYNISIGGMYVNADVSRGKGSLVRFELGLDDEAAIRGLAEVVWVRADTGGGRGPGMGLKFRFLEQRDRQMIFKLVSQHIKDRLSQRQAEEVVPEGVSPLDRIAPPAATDPPIADGSPAFGAPTVAVPPLEEPPEAVDFGFGTTSPDVEGSEPGVQGSLFDAPAKVPTFTDPPTFSSAPTSFAPPEPSFAPAEPPAEDPGPVSGAPSAFESPATEDSVRGTGAGLLPEVDDMLADGGGVDTAAVVDAMDGTSTGAGVSDQTLDAFDAAEAAGLPDGHYPGDDGAHFGHRPKSRRSGLVLALAATVLALAAGGYALWSSGVLVGAESADTESAAATASLDDAAQASESGDDAAPEPDGPAPADTGVDAGARDTQTAAAVRGGGPQRTGGASAFRRVRGISWSQAAGGVRIRVDTDGDVPRRRIEHFRLDGAKPRHVVKLFGAARYDKGAVPADGALVTQVRTGWHRKPDGGELHVVLDLADSGVRVTGVEPASGGLDITVARP